jgi:glycosyltransferase involved in cell wall biosynthesis
MKYPRILFIHPDLYAFGGAEQVCVRMMAAAQRLGEVTLVHCGGALECDRIHAWSNVALDTRRVTFVTAGTIGGLLAGARRKPIMKYALAMRYARPIVHKFDLVIGTFGECPLRTGAGIQFVHVPVFCDAMDALRYLNIEHDGASQARLRRSYIRLSRWLSSWEVEQVRSKTTITNSAWTAEVVQRLYGISSLVVPPGADVRLRPGDVGWTDWQHRQSGFVMLGRIHPSKRLEFGVEIIRRVRSRGYDVQLHIAGRSGGKYVEQLRRSIAGMTWVHLHVDLPQAELERLVVRQKFGLHACQFEHYGIAAVEMQALGCIVFVPDFAGQREVVTSPLQRWVDIDDAVTKITELLGNPDLCERLSDSAVQATENASAQRFMERVGEILEQTLAQRTNASAS